MLSEKHAMKGIDEKRWRSGMVEKWNDCGDGFIGSFSTGVLNDKKKTYVDFSVPSVLSAVKRKWILEFFLNTIIQIESWNVKNLIKPLALSISQ